MANRRPMAAPERKTARDLERSDLPETEALAFRHLLIRDAAYDAMPKRQRAALHEEFAAWLASRLGDAAPDEIVGVTLAYLGKDPNSENLDDLKAAEAVLMKIRPYIRMIHSSQYIDSLANGDLCVSLGWSGDILQAKARGVRFGPQKSLTPLQITELREKRRQGVLGSNRDLL